MDTTYRLIEIGDRRNAGQTAATPELAKLVPGNLDRSQRLGVEQTDWEDNFGKKRAQRTILIDAEDHPGQWALGAATPSQPGAQDVPDPAPGGFQSQVNASLRRPRERL